jgi:hypothetical protein
MMESETAANKPCRDLRFEEPAAELGGLRTNPDDSLELELQHGLNPTGDKNLFLCSRTLFRSETRVQGASSGNNNEGANRRLRLQKIQKIWTAY